jgi:hypothetical protein
MTRAHLFVELKGTIKHGHMSSLATVENKESTFKDLRMILVMRIISHISRQTPPREPRQPCLRGVTQNLPLLERHIRLVKLDLRVQSGDIDHFRHTGCGAGKLLNRFVVVIGLERGVHFAAGPKVGDLH